MKPHPTRSDAYRLGRRVIAALKNGAEVKVYKVVDNPSGFLAKESVSYDIVVEGLMETVHGKEKED